MTMLTKQKTIIALKKNDGKMKFRFDGTEFAYKDGHLFLALKSKAELSECWIPDDSGIEYPCVVSCSLDTAQPSQKFLKGLLEELEADKVYTGFVVVDDSLEMYKKAGDNPAYAEILKGESLSATALAESQLIKLDELKAPEGGSGRKYNPMQKFETTQKLLGESGSFIEIVAYINALDPATKETTIKLLEICV